MPMNARRQLNVWSIGLLAALVALLVVANAFEGGGAIAAVLAVPVFLLLAWVTVLRSRV